MSSFSHRVSEDLLASLLRPANRTLTGEEAQNVACHQKHSCTCRRMRRPPLLVEPIHLGTELKKKFLNKDWKKEIFTMHEHFERRISKATGRGVVSITVTPPRASLRNPWLVSLKCNDSILKLTNLYDELVSATGPRPITYLSCSGRPLAPNSLICDIRWNKWPPTLAASQ